MAELKKKHDVSGVHVMTRAQMERKADKLAQRVLQVRDRHVAYEMLDAGELDGMAIEIMIHSYRWMLDEDR